MLSVKTYVLDIFLHVVTFYAVDIAVSYTHLDVYKRQHSALVCITKHDISVFKQPPYSPNCVRLLPITSSSSFARQPLVGPGLL